MAAGRKEGLGARRRSLPIITDGSYGVHADRFGGHPESAGHRAGRYNRTFSRRAGLRVRGRLHDRRRGDNGGLRAWPGVHGNGAAGRHHGRGRPRLLVRQGPAAARRGRRVPQLGGQLHGVWAKRQRHGVRRPAQVRGHIREGRERFQHLVPQPIHTAGGADPATISEKGTGGATRLSSSPAVGSRSPVRPFVLQGTKLRKSSGRRVPGVRRRKSIRGCDILKGVIFVAYTIRC